MRSQTLLAQCLANPYSLVVFIALNMFYNGFIALWMALTNACTISYTTYTHILTLTTINQVWNDTIWPDYSWIAGHGILRNSFVLKEPILIGKILGTCDVSTFSYTILCFANVLYWGMWYIAIPICRFGRGKNGRLQTCTT